MSETTTNTKLRAELAIAKGELRAAEKVIRVLAGSEIVHPNTEWLDAPNAEGYWWFRFSEKDPDHIIVQSYIEDDIMRVRDFGVDDVFPRIPEGQYQLVPRAR